MKNILFQLTFILFQVTEMFFMVLVLVNFNNPCSNTLVVCLLLLLLILWSWNVTSIAPDERIKLTFAVIFGHTGWSSGYNSLKKTSLIDIMCFFISKGLRAAQPVQAERWDRKGMSVFYLLFMYRSSPAVSGMNEHSAVLIWTNISHIWYSKNI